MKEHQKSMRELSRTFQGTLRMKDTEEMRENTIESSIPYMEDSGATTICGKAFSSGWVEKIPMET